MRIKQDLSIALVLAVIGSGMASPALSRERCEALARVEAAIDENRLSAEESERVRALIAEARKLQREGDEDGSASAMAQALTLLRTA